MNPKFTQFTMTVTNCHAIRTMTSLFLVLMTASSASAIWMQDDDRMSPNPSQPISVDTRKALQKDLDDGASAEINPKIDASRITELSLPTIPTEIILPTPPIHRIATERAQTRLNETEWKTAVQSMKTGLGYLAATQSKRGAWFEGKEVIPTDQPPKEAAAATAVTALGLKAFAQAPNLAPNLMVAEKALDFLRMKIEEDGFEGLNEGGLGNYVTSALVMGLAAVGTDTGTLMNGVQWLQQTQWDAEDGLDPRQDWYGGAGYGNRGRPDLSNTQMMLDALYDAGVSPDEPSVQRALIFLTRTQNLKETNPAEWAQAGNNDGGFIYTPANNGESMASQAAGEGRYGESMPAGEPRSLRSYGSMTYAGFKSLLYAGLDANDSRVHAALDWARKHWTFEENPGVGQQGYYYYLHAMARALRASGLSLIKDDQGKAHNWRSELINALTIRQKNDGSWQNPVDRWEEGRPDLATIYALLALEEAMKPTLEIE